MHLLKTAWFKYWPIIVLAVLELGLILTNIPFDGRWFLGWDSTTPEINLPLNLHRFFFGVWQEYRGLGTVDGMAHTANIVHWLYSGILSLALPVEVIRPVLNNITHFVAGWGTYVLVRTILRSRRQPAENKRLDSQDRWFSFISALFVMFNLLTIQMYNMPLELFSFHFAVLPWTLWALTQYVLTAKRQYLAGLAVIAVAGVSQAHVPTIFVSYGLFCAVWALGLLWGSAWKVRLRRGALALGVLILVNAFWLLPYTYTVITKTAEISGAKQNVIGTPSVFYRNSVWGNTWALFSFGGFQLDYYDWDEATETFLPIMESWRTLWNSAYYAIGIVLISLIMMFGLYAALAKKPQHWQPAEVSSALAWIFCFVMLGTSVPIIGSISEFFREYVPLFEQIFRFTFTKFSLGYVIFSGILIALGLEFLLKMSQKVPLGKSLQYQLLSGIGLVLLLATSWPIWGKLYYEKLFVPVPESYFSFAEYFNSQHPFGRYATFPVHSLWGWTTNTTNWGYRGSGFLWQLVGPAMVDRAFDPWSKFNETVYFQLKTGLYRQESKQFTDTLAKFHLTHILDDLSVYHPGSYPEALFRNETPQFFSELASIQQEEQFTNLALYTIAQPDGRTTLPFAPKQLQQINPSYEAVYTTYDPAYSLGGDYIAATGGAQYPFSFLALDDLARAKQTAVSEVLSVGSDTVTLQVPLAAGKLSIPEFQSMQAVLPVALSVSGNPTDLTSATVALSPYLPTIQIGAQQVFEPRQQHYAIPRMSAYYIVVNDKLFLINDAQRSQVSNFSTTGQNYLSVFGTRPNQVSSVALSTELERCDFMQSFGTQSATDAVIENPVCQTAQVTIPNSMPDDDTALNTQTSPSGQQLIALTFDSTSTAAVLPELCVTQASRPEYCLNEPLRISANNITQGTITLVLPVSSLEPLRLYFFAGSASNRSAERVLYSQLSLQTFPLVFNEQVQLDQQLRDLHTALTQTTVNQGETLRILFNNLATMQIVPDWNNSLTAQNNCSRDGRGTVSKQVNGQTVTLQAREQGIFCEELLLPDLLPENEYLYLMTGEHITGAGTKIFIKNPYTKQMDVETITPEGVFATIVPLVPSRNKYTTTNNGFTISYTTESFGSEDNTTNISSQRLVPLPTRWLSSLRNEQSASSSTVENPLTVEEVTKRGPYFYTVVTLALEAGVLALPQSYDPGWIAFPTGRPWQQLEHVTYNGWANGWIIPADRGEPQRITLLFWPQLLSFAGYGILLVTLSWLGVVAWQERQQKQLFADQLAAKQARHPHAKQQIDTQVRRGFAGHGLQKDWQLLQREVAESAQIIAHDISSLYHKLQHAIRKLLEGKR